MEKSFATHVDHLGKIQPKNYRAQYFSSGMISISQFQRNADKGSLVIHFVLNGIEYQTQGKFDRYVTNRELNQYTHYLP